MTEKIEKNWPRQIKPDGVSARPANDHKAIQMLAQLLKKRRGRAK